MNRRPGNVEVIKADPRVWDQAVALAGGDFARLEILANGAVVVHNNPIRKHNP